MILKVDGKTILELVRLKPAKYAILQKLQKLQKKCEKIAKKLQKNCKNCSLNWIEQLIDPTDPSLRILYITCPSVVLLACLFRFESLNTSFELWILDLKNYNKWEYFIFHIFQKFLIKYLLFLKTLIQNICFGELFSTIIHDLRTKLQFLTGLGQNKIILCFR